MSEQPEPEAPKASIDQLLAEAGWARRLAVRLVRDEALADDLVQEAWEVALHDRPDADRPVRPWLAQVLRNRFRMRLRQTERRDQRDDRWTSEGAAAAPSSEALVARLQEQRRLGGLVLALEEPFRSTLLLRFYEDLDGAEIARRLAIPAGTVRWRLKEGLDRLRRTLDAQHGGDRQAWQRALAPLGGVPLTTLAKGGLVMKLALVLGLLGGVSTAVVVAQHRAPPLPTPTQIASAPPTARPALPRLDRAGREALLSRLAHARPAPSAAAPRKLDKDYIHEEITDLLPLVQECFEAALEQHPNLSGKLMVRFTIVGEPGIGGLISESTIEDGESTISDAGVRECIANTMYAAQFPAPEGGGQMVVEYPFVLVADDSDDDKP
jgi:RNA polymerase sigma-70 factor (ECF subfamily)